ncbi:MAG: phosphoglycerate dehydrogenase [Lentisphaerae bacterium]|nr:phosphoglycerate dehydrogenase [Lentisphaerota bacterium]
MRVKPRILVTPRSVTKTGHPALQHLREAGFDVCYCTPGKQPDEAELLRLLPGCVGYLAGVEKVTARVLEAASDLRVISRNGTGVDNVDAAAARARGITICRAEGANARGVAELTFGLMLALARSIPCCDRSLKGGGWDRPTGIELSGKTLGLVGCGRIGRLVAGFGLAFDMEVLAYDPAPALTFAPSPRFHYTALDDLLGQADFVSLHAPLAKDGQALIGGASLQRMKRGAYLINTARGSLLDDDAVLAALDSEHLAGVALDAFDPEPPTDLRLVSHPRVIATPHAGGLTRESIDRAIEVAVANLLEFLRNPTGVR